MQIYPPLSSLVLAFAPALPLAAQDIDDTAEEGVIVVVGEGLEDTPSVAAYSSIEIDREVIVSSP